MRRNYLVGSHRERAADLIFQSIRLNQQERFGALFFGEAAIDRQIFYPSEVLLDTDLLNLGKNDLLGLGYALQDILGAGTCVGGFACTQTTVPSLAVLVGPGRIYSLQNVDNTPYGSLPQDTSDQLIKQGIQLGSITLATPAPATAGQSINYLIEASYQDVDTTDVVPPFFNSANPQVPFSGLGNNGAPLPTQRKGTVVLTAKPGAAAATGSQTTPAPDSGFVGLYVVTVANGQASVTSTNITQLQTAPFLPSNLGSPLASNVNDAAPALLTSTVLANTGLALNLPVGSYDIEILLNIGGVTTGTQGVNLNTNNGTAVFGTGAASATVLGVLLGAVNGAAQNTTFNGSKSFAAISVLNNVDSVFIKYGITVTQAGTFILQAAQNSASGNAVRIYGFMKATRV